MSSFLWRDMNRMSLALVRSKFQSGLCLEEMEWSYGALKPSDVRDPKPRPKGAPVVCCRTHLHMSIPQYYIGNSKHLWRTTLFMAVRCLCALGLSETKIHDSFPQGPYQVTEEKAGMSIIIHKKMLR